jgi:outer membrane protein assembly factor BamB
VRLAAALLSCSLVACGVDEAPAGETPFTPRSQSGSVARSLDADWPQWRGLRRDGKSPETGIADRLPPEGPAVLWDRPLGSGFSGISVAGDRLFTAYGDDDSSYLVRLDAATGDEVWRYRLGDVFEERNGSGPRATPTIDGELVYMMTSRAVLVAVDGATGQERWRVELAGELAVEEPEFRGYSSSPLIEGELVVVQVGPVDGASLAALEKDTGRVAWTALDGRSAFSSPIAATIHDRRQIVATIASGIAGVDAATGERLWELPWETRYEVSVATPIHLEPDRVFVSVGYGKGAVMLSASVEQGTWTARPLWTSRSFRNHFSSSIHHDGHLYGFDEAVLKCIGDRDGAERWNRRGLGKGTLIHADGVLIVLGESGLLSLVEATPEECRELGSVQVLEGKCWTAPSLAAGRLYLRNTERIVCLDLRSSDAATEPVR